MADKDDLLDYAAWVEIIDEEKGIGRQWLAPRSFIDSMASTEEIEFRKKQLRHRADEFAAHSVFAFIMDAEE